MSLSFLLAACSAEPEPRRECDAEHTDEQDSTDLAELQHDSGDDALMADAHPDGRGDADTMPDGGDCQMPPDLPNGNPYYLDIGRNLADVPEYYHPTKAGPCLVEQADQSGTVFRRIEFEYTPASILYKRVVDGADFSNLPDGTPDQVFVHHAGYPGMVRWDADGNGENDEIVMHRYEDGRRVLDLGMATLEQVVGSSYEVQYEYDRCGRVISADRSFGVDRTFEYDERGRLALRRRFDDAGDLFARTEYTYQREKLTELRTYSAGASQPKRIETFEYQNDGRLSRRELQLGEPVEPTVVFVFETDNLGNITRIATSDAETGDISSIKTYSYSCL